MTNIPGYQERPVDAQTGQFSLPWRRWLEAVNVALNAAGGDTASLAADVAAIATALGSPDGTVANIPDQASLGDVIYGRNGVMVTGRLGVSPVYVELQAIEDDGTGALLAFTCDEYGRVTGTRAVAPSDFPPGLGGVPYEVADGTSYPVAAGIQALYSTPIDLLGASYLDLSGALVEVT